MLGAPRGGQSLRRCICRHLVFAAAGDTCPRCRRVFPAERVVSTLGVEGRLRFAAGRVLGVVDGGRP